MDVEEAIRTRRSIRDYTDEPVGEDLLDRLLESARWAPSGLNNQPWRFMKVLDRDLIDRLAELTKYRGVVHGAAALILVFLDRQDSYDRDRDMQSVGAAMQNMLLAAHSAGLGACWLGEVLNRREDVEKLLGTGMDLEFVAMLSIGHPVERENVGVRHPLSKLEIEAPAD